MGDKVTVKTNRRWYELKCWHDLPTQARADFDYVEEDDRFSARFVKYRRRWYDLNEFQVKPNGCQYEWMRDWHGFQSDTFFSGVLCRYDSTCELAQMGTYFS